MRGTEGGAGPFFSPDGEWLGFVTQGPLALRKMSIFGGAPTLLTESPASVLGASWRTNDEIVPLSDTA